jgi:hypothetical protein
MLPAFYINSAFLEYLAYLGKVYNEIDSNMILYDLPGTKLILRSSAFVLVRAVRLLGARLQMHHSRPQESQSRLHH